MAWPACAGPYDLILCNPPYVNAHSMAALPAEYRAEPALALAGGGTDGMDFIRSLLRDAPAHMSEQRRAGAGNRQRARPFRSRLSRTLEVVWLDTSAGDDQVLLLTRSNWPETCVSGRHAQRC